MSHARRRPLARTLAGALAGAVVASTAALSVAPSAEAAPRNAEAFGLTANGRLVTFDLARPGRVEVIGKVSGLGGQRLVGIDIRVATNKLYGLGDGGGVYVLNRDNGKARRVGALSEPLAGKGFDIDVNPAADALRIVSNTGQNLRYSFADGTTTVDGTLNVPDMTPVVRGIVGAAYTNNDTDEDTGTALFDLNATTDSIALQIPANSGTITPQGPLGKKTSLQSGFDIRTERAGGQAVSNDAYATLGGSKGYSLFKISTLTGKATRIGAFKQQVVDLAVKHG